MFIDVVLIENTIISINGREIYLSFLRVGYSEAITSNWFVSYLVPKLAHKCCTWLGRLLAVDSAERVLVDRLTRDVGEARIRNGDCERTSGDQ